MEAHEALEEFRTEALHERARHDQESRFRNRAAIVIAVMAALLALTTVLSDIAVKRQVIANVDVADSRSTIDARTTDLNAQRLAVGSMQEQLADSSITGERRALIQQHMQEEQKLVAQTLSNPETGEGIKELQARLDRRRESRGPARPERTAITSQKCSYRSQSCSPRLQFWVWRPSWPSRSSPAWSGC